MVLTGTPARHDEARAAAAAFVPGADLTVELHDLPEGRLPAKWGQVKDLIEAQARRVAPDVIIAPSPDDAHQDHRTAGEIVPTVFRDALYLGYEIPKWDGDLCRPSLYVPLPDGHRAAQGRTAAQVLPVPAAPGLVGRRGLPRPGAAARHGMPLAVRRGVPLHEGGSRRTAARSPAGPRKGRLVKVRPVPQISGAMLFEPTPHTDERGFFSRTFDADVAAAAGVDPAAFVQDSLSRSARGVIRGLHVRSGPGEAKLVRCSYGAVFDVVVDLRPDSPTFRQWESFDLRDDSQVSLYVPAGCAHGFQALTDPADVAYRIDRRHDPSQDVTIAYDDPDLGIGWPVRPAVMSARDRAGQPLAAALALLA